MVDLVVDRRELKATISRLLHLLTDRPAEAVARAPLPPTVAAS